MRTPGTLSSTPSGGIRVYGVNEAIAELEKVKVSTRGALRLAAAGGAETIAPAAQAKAPRKTGLLARSIRVYAGRSLGPYRAVSYVGTKVYYGRFQEKGTEKMEANPYLEPAAEQQAAAVEAAMRAIYRAAIQRGIAL